MTTKKQERLEAIGSRMAFLEWCLKNNGDDFMLQWELDELIAMSREVDLVCLIGGEENCLR